MSNKDRKPLAPKYTPERASTILAEAELFGDIQACDKWQITRQTLHNYRCKLRDDDDLLQLFTLKKRLLVANWQQDATKTIKVGLTELNRRMPLAATEEDAKVIHAIAGACKIVGELKIASDALSEPTDYQQSSTIEEIAR